MASRETIDNPIWSEAKTIINTLFHDDTKREWKRLEQRKIIAAASGASTVDFNIKHHCEILADIKEGFSHIFDHSHVDTFWEGLVFKLKKATSINPVVSRKRKNEAHLVTSLIYPTLRKVVDSISIILEKHTTKHTNGLTVPRPQIPVTSHLVIQDEVKTGNTSIVDASIQINDGKECKVLIPVEAKVEIEDDKDLYQIAAYVTKVSTAQQLEKKAVIGIIIDKENFHLVFSPYSYLDESGATIPLPIVYVSPPITWRNDSPQTLFSIIPAALLVIACTCHFQLGRIEYTETDIDPQVLKTACKLLETRHKIDPFCGDILSAIHDLAHISNQHQIEIADIKKEIDDLKKQQQNGTHSDSQSSSISVN